MAYVDRTDDEWQDDGDDDFDDLPATSLDDDDYEAFLSREFDGEGRLRDGPPVGRWIAIAIVAAAVLALFVAL